MLFGAKEGNMPEVNLESLQKDVVRLQEILLKNQQDVINKDSLDKAVTDVMAKLHPPEKKMVFGKVDSENADQKEIGFVSFLKMVKNNDPHLKTVLSGGNTGAYLIPTEYANEIISEVPLGAVAYPKCKDVPLVRSLKTPKRATNITMAWTAEDGNKTLSVPTFSQLDLTLKDLTTVVPFTDQMLSDENTGIVSILMQWVADYIAAEKDRLVLVGDVSGLSDPFNGVYYATGTKSVAQAGANLAYDDFVDLMTAVPAAYQMNAEWYLNLLTLGLAMKIKDLDGQPIFKLGAGTPEVPSSILGKKINLTDSISSTMGTGADSAIIYGDISKSVVLGHKATGNLEVTVSNSAVAPVTGSLTQNAFLQNETWYRFVLRHAQDVVLASIMGRLTGVK